MASKLRSYPDKYDWVKVKSNRKHNLGKREWNQQTNVPIKEGEELILPRGCSDPDESLDGMKYYFKNNFYQIIDAEPFSNKNSSESAPEDNDDGFPASESDVETPEPSIVNEENNEEKDPSDMAYGELQSWASEKDGVQGNQSKDELVEAYKEKELKTSGEDE